MGVKTGWADRRMRVAQAGQCLNGALTTLGRGRQREAPSQHASAPASGIDNQEGGHAPGPHFLGEAEWHMALMD